MPLSLKLTPRSWVYKEPFVIARGVLLAQDTLLVELTDEAGRRGQGEACGIPYKSETPETIAADIAAVRREIEAGITRAELLNLLPPGGARCALDFTLWDLEAKRGGPDPFTANGLSPNAVASGITIGIRDQAGYETAARAARGAAALKVKVDDRDPLAALAAVRRGAPHTPLIVDPNQAWSIDQLKALAPGLAAMGTVLLEQPIPVGSEAGLDGYQCPVPLCADELVDSEQDLARARNRFGYVNIKLDKCGGLTAGLALADAAEAMGFELMVGCMGGSSLVMAPAMVLAQRCRFVDLDAPPLNRTDTSPGFAYLDGLVAEPHLPALWG